MINYILVFIFFIFGTFFGSFYNVMIDRLPNDEDIFKKRSSCGYCHHTLKWYDLIPVVSFLAVRGKCRYCGGKLSCQYLLSELFTGALFALAYWWYGYNDLLSVFIAIAFFSLLFVVAMIDFKAHIIMDLVVIVFTVIGVVLKIIRGDNILTMVLGGVAGFGLYLLIYLFAKLVFKKEGFGQGDIVFMTAIGLFFDYQQALAIGILSFYVCFLFMVIAWIYKKIMMKKKDTSNSSDELEEIENIDSSEEADDEEGAERVLEIPFAPGMSVTALVFLLFGSQIMEVIFNLLGFY